MTLSLYGHSFELRYGYYEESDRQWGEPVVIYPDLKTTPLYSEDGYPLVTAVQSPCEQYTAVGHPPDDCCSDCVYYMDSKKEIELCLCEARRIKTGLGGDTT